MDEAYTGSAIADVGAEPGGDGQPSARDEADALCSELLRDENEGLAERHWSYPGMAAALQSLMGSVQSQRLQHALSLTPSLLSVYFAVALRDVNDCKFHLTPPLVLGVVIVNLWIDLGNKRLDPRKKCVECKVWGSLGKEN
jgi:AP-5 complex subunit zeta-1